MRFFVVGSGRCGSSMLWRMLNLHPNLFVFRETHWIPKLVELFGEEGAPPADLLEVVDKTRFVDGTTVTTVSEELRRSLLALGERVTVREFCDGLGRGLASEQGKTWWADKTPDYVTYMIVLQGLFPGCRFLHLVRDGRAVVRSMETHPGYRWLASAGEISWVPAAYNGYHTSVPVLESIPRSAFATLWRRRVRRAQEQAARLVPGTYREVRYEDLLAEPEATLRGLSSFLELEKGEEWIRSASSIADPSRLSRQAGEGGDPGFGPEDWALQRQLGYS